MLIVIPLLFSLLFLMLNKKFYTLLSYLQFGVCSLLAISLFFSNPITNVLQGTNFLTLKAVFEIVEFSICIYIFYLSFKNSKPFVFLLNLLQVILLFYNLIFIKSENSFYFSIDKLSLLMLLIINIIGTLIVIFSRGYIDKYEEHRKLKSRQKTFYLTICIFLSAMNGLVISDSLNLVYLFWEITTLASFILISYNQDMEAISSGFNALFLNLIGGIAFFIGIILFKTMLNIETFSQIALCGSLSSIYTIPAILLLIAGFAKSAQLPFNSWLLGAMVAPTPVSALLHSSTMVKAGVYLIIKLAPTFSGTRLGIIVSILGALSFLICSLIAVGEKNAKRILAYSTIANLGLIICSTGMGTSATLSAAIILILFHALSKALLFLCTGEIEHTIGSRLIDDMTGLIKKSPTLTIITCFGIVSMILPPFGVLITKWICLEASKNNLIVTIFLVLGSALTTLFWIKWLGTLLSYPTLTLKSSIKRNFNIYLPLTIFSSLIIIAAGMLSPIYSYFVEPEILKLLHLKGEIIVNFDNVILNTGAFNDTLIFILLCILLVLTLTLNKIFGNTIKLKKIYLCGENNDDENHISFRNGFGTSDDAMVSNFYFPKIFDEKTFTKVGYLLSITLLVLAFAGGIL